MKFRLNKYYLDHVRIALIGSGLSIKEVVEQVSEIGFLTSQFNLTGGDEMIKKKEIPSLPHTKAGHFFHYANAYSNDAVRAENDNQMNLAWSYITSAAYYEGAFVAATTSLMRRRIQAYESAMKKLTTDSDGKQNAKAIIKKEWEKWQKKPNSYPSKAAFARAMLGSYTNLESHRVIERWCKGWGESSQ